jgi:hypothetical protein
MKWPVMVAGGTNLSVLVALTLPRQKHSLL